MHIKYFEWRMRNNRPHPVTGKTPVEELADRSRTTITVEKIKANWAGASQEKLLASAKDVMDNDGQTDLAINLRQAFREMLRERGLRLWEATQSTN